jgi:tetratricopeptide (TPR) repeat protein
MHARWTRILAALFAAALLAGTARAEEPSAEAEARIQKGVELRRAGKNGEALSEFQKAFALTPTPRAQAQIALALHALGDWLGAERALEQALLATGDPWITQYRDALEGALATVRAHLGWLSVSANVPLGELFLNGVSVHALPLPDSIRVVAGKLDAEVRAQGYAPVLRAIDIAPGREDHETFTLEPLPAAPSPSQPSAQESSERAARAVDVPPSSPTSEARRSAPAWRSPLVGYLALGAAGAFAAGGVVAWRVRQDNVDMYNDNSRCLVGTRTRGEQCGQFADAANEAMGLEIAAFAVAAGAAGLGTWLLLTTSPAKPSSQAVSCAPWGHVGLACAAHF